MYGTSQDALLCAICSEKFNTHTKQPLLLACFHTFCQECLNKLPKPHDQPWSIVCPLCSTETPGPSPTSLPINYALMEIVEASAACGKEKMCDIHEEIHPAIFYCFECEQSMCDEAHKTHGRVKATKQHQTCMIGEPRVQIIRKQPLCRAHGKELDLVCTHSSHSPNTMVCILCIVTTHQSHSCVTVEDYFNQKQGDVHEILVRAKEVETKLALGVAAAEARHASAAQNQESIAASINAYFTKIQNDLEIQRKELLLKLASTCKDKGKVLQQKQKSLEGTLHGIQIVSQQLDALVQDGNSKAKALVMMDQMQTHLKLIEKDALHEQEFDQIQFLDSPYSLPEVSLIDLAISTPSIYPFENGFPVFLSTSVPLSRFDISISNCQDMLPTKTGKAKNGNYLIEPKNSGSGEHIVEVRLLGKHVRGSPLSVYTGYSWSLSQTRLTNISGTIMEAINTHAWGMVQEIFGMAKQTLTIKIDHKNTNTHCQIALYASPSVQFGCSLPSQYLATYNTYQKAKSSISILKLTRKNDGQISLSHDDQVIWDVPAPACYVYLDVCHASTTAEIL
eukprot:Phypoly_transcript_05421.p1 GENE.Phypoly_transcript_05421~~Phypoly_transcript_05421.p1  ORF type:complete len:564 (+),score=63.52 Phypoly_transcript_05421:246-1937(+)